MPGVHKRVINELLRPRQWKPNMEDRRFMLTVGVVFVVLVEVGEGKAEGEGRATGRQGRRAVVCGCERRGMKNGRFGRASRGRAAVEAQHGGPALHAYCEWKGGGGCSRRGRWWRRRGGGGGHEGSKIHTLALLAVRCVAYDA
jgi:hypothetical protein